MARVGLGVLVESGKAPNVAEWRDLWVQRLKDLWNQDEDPAGIELVKVWEELEGGIPRVSKPQHLVELLDVKAAPGLWGDLLRALNGDPESKKILLEKFPQEDPAPSLEEQREELEQASLNDLAGSVADPSPYTRAAGL